MDFVIRRISRQDTNRIIEINYLANLNRRNPHRWSEGFNTYLLKKEVIDLLIKKYNHLNDDASIICYEKNGKIAGYFIYFYINANNRALHKKNLNVVFGKDIASKALLNFKEKDIISISENHKIFWESLERGKRDKLNYVYGLQIAVHRNYKRQGIGKALFNHLFKSSKEKGASFFIGDVEIYPSFNIAQFEFLFKRLDFQIPGLVKTYFNPNEIEKCALLYKKL